MSTNFNANPIFIQGSVTGYKSQTHPHKVRFAH